MLWTLTRTTDDANTISYVSSSFQTDLCSVFESGCGYNTLEANLLCLEPTFPQLVNQVVEDQMTSIVNPGVVRQLSAQGE